MSKSNSTHDLRLWRGLLQAPWGRLNLRMRQMSTNTQAQRQKQLQAESVTPSEGAATIKYRQEPQARIGRVDRHRHGIQLRLPQGSCRADL